MFRASAQPRPSAIDSVTERTGYCTDGVRLENVPWAGLMVFVAHVRTQSNHAIITSFGKRNEWAIEKDTKYWSSWWI
jgi:hypothetical protein